MEAIGVRWRASDERRRTTAASGRRPQGGKVGMRLMIVYWGATSVFHMLSLSQKWLTSSWMSGSRRGCTIRCHMTSINFGIDNFDDSGVDLYPILEAPIHCHAVDSIVNQIEDVAIRFYEVANFRGQKSERSDLSDALSQEIARKNRKRDSGKVEDQKEVESEYNFYLKKKLSNDVEYRFVTGALVLTL